MDRPPPDPAGLLEHGTGRERGEATPGAVITTPVVGGAQELLEAMIEPDGAGGDS